MRHLTKLQNDAESSRCVVSLYQAPPSKKISIRSGRNSGRLLCWYVIFSWQALQVHLKTCMRPVYAAVCGLPEPRKHHAVLMCRFARNCLHSMRKLVMEMSDSLGPDTLELKLRIGLHSGSMRVLVKNGSHIYIYAGPVTAGVLRGDRARFQLFGTFLLSFFSFVRS
jgi:hypothetical protein